MLTTRFALVSLHTITTRLFLLFLVGLSLSFAEAPLPQPPGDPEPYSPVPKPDDPAYPVSFSGRVLPVAPLLP